MRTMRLMSILKTVWTWALVRLESTIRWAMMERIRVRGTSSSPAATTGVGGGRGVDGLAAAGGGPGGGGAPGGLGARGAVAPPLARKPRISSLVILPDEPVPGTWRRSRLFSLAILRTRGEERTRSPGSVSAISLSVSVSAAGAGAEGCGAAPARLEDGGGPPAPPPLGTTRL